MKLAVFYHAKISGDGIPDPDQALDILSEQMLALKDSGLAASASLIRIHLEGTASDLLLASSLAPDKSTLKLNTGRGEGFTMDWLRHWVIDHRDWFVCYHHSKGVSNPSEMNHRWRRCLERTVIWNWSICLQYLLAGYHTVGAHWYRNKDQRYWAGNFWWASADYLSLLPPVPLEHVNGKSYESEVWIGKAPFGPKISDLAPHRVMAECP